MQQVIQGLLTMAITTQQTSANLVQSTSNLERSATQLTQSVLAHEREIQKIWEYLRNRNGGSSPPN